MIQHVGIHHKTFCGTNAMCHSIGDLPDVDEVWLGFADRDEQTSSLDDIFSYEMTGKWAIRCWLSTNQLYRIKWYFCYRCFYQTQTTSSHEWSTSCTSRWWSQPPWLVVLHKGMYYPVFNEDDNESNIITRVPISSAQIRFDGCIYHILAAHRGVKDLPLRCSPVYWEWY